MSKADKDWTFVNNDGSVELDARSQKNVRDSDSDQDFEVLAKPNSDMVPGSGLVKFEGIFIKEDHFGDRLKDDGSDIEVLKKSQETPKDDLPNVSDTDDKDSIEILESGYGDHHEPIAGNWSLLDQELIEAASSSDSDFEKVQLLEEASATDLVDGIEDIASLFCEEATESEADISAVESDNEFDGLDRLFGNTEDKLADREEQDVDKLFEALKTLFKDTSNTSYSNEPHMTDDGIVLSTSMFIILLCLSVSAGLVIGKGLTCLSQVYDVNNVMKESNTTVEAPLQRDVKGKKLNDVNTTHHLHSLRKILESEKGENKGLDIRLAYHEMQLKYHQLQRKYSFLGQQYHMQKQILILSKKMKNLNDIKMNSGNDSDNQNSSNMEKELLWWKMRTAVWRRKYLDLKVQFLEGKGNRSNTTHPNITFQACAGLLTKYIPDLNMKKMLRSETSNRIASGAKMCWRKVFSPVKTVGEHMGSSLFGFSRRMDGFWKQMKTKWDKPSREKRQDKDDVRSKMSSKWRRFRRVFAMSNIVGSFEWKKGRKMSPKKIAKQKKQGLAKEFCEIKPFRFSNEFKERWSQDAQAKDEEVSYLPPQLGKYVKMSSANAESSASESEEETNEDEVEMFRQNVNFVNKNDFKTLPCLRRESEKVKTGESSSQLDSKEAKLKERYERFEDKMRRQSNKRREKEGELKRKLKDFEDYQSEKQSSMKEKREILEKKMRKHSNRKRNEERLFKRREKKLEYLTEKMENKFEKVFERKARELEIKKKKLERKLRKIVKKNEDETRKFVKEKEKFRQKAEKLKRKLKKSENELMKRKEELQKWSDEMKRKQIRENAEKIHERYSEAKKWKERKETILKNMNEKIKIQEEKLEQRRSTMNAKVEQLRSALRSLLQEERSRIEEIDKKNEELRTKQNQVDVIKMFYAGVLKQEKERHAKAKEMVWQMKQRVIKLKEAHHEILNKYKIMQQKLAREREELKADETKILIRQPTVYCADQRSCQDETKTGEHGYMKMTHNDGATMPSVFCPNKDSCRDNEGIQRQLEESERLLRKRKWQWDSMQTEAKVLKKTFVASPIPPKAHDVAKVNPFFFDLFAKGNKTENEAASAPNKAKPELEKKILTETKTQNSNWYFSRMEERANQRAVPLSWYLYWTQGRKSWRNAPGKSDSDNWYLKFMRERERQRDAPVDRYFKRGKGKEEGFLQDKSSWLLDRGKGREDARKKEGFYYCW